MITYVRLPRNRWPKWWVDKGYKDPVVPLILALYGHPDSGGYWEKHCISVLKPLGWEPVPTWPSVFWNPKRKALLVVYVDDFALAAHEKHHDELWKQVKSVTSMGKEVDYGRFLGCNLVPFECTAGDVASILRSSPQYYQRPLTGKAAREQGGQDRAPLEIDYKRKVRGVIADME